MLSSRPSRGSWAGCVLAAAAAGGPALAQGDIPRLIDKADYTSRLRAMWLGECCANWTGLRTEGHFEWPPMLTDANWNANLPPPAPAWYMNLFAPVGAWGADDDTDIEYVYLHLLDVHTAPGILNAEQIRGGWRDHINSFIWVSNASARSLMERGARPPGTGMYIANPNAFMIDAQLTTEYFGALWPGMPERALRAADLPIRTTADGHAAHASQFYVVLYSLAPIADRSLPARERVLWMYREARKFIPDSSKAADVADFVLADYLANPDADNWERTRDLVQQRYQLQAGSNGFVYRGWYESSVNFAGGLIALLYGEGDYVKTVRIGSLSGWDSDNGTATMGGLLGLLLGYQAIEDAMNAERGWPQGTPQQDLYWIGRTRVGLPDRFPAIELCDDSLAMMAQRSAAVIDRAVASAGGLVSGTQWLLPPGGAGAGLSAAEALAMNPRWADYQRSVRRLVLDAGGTVQSAASVFANPYTIGGDFGTGDPSVMSNGLELDARGLEEVLQPYPVRRQYFSTLGAAPWAAAGLVQSVETTFSQAREVHAVRFVEGDHFYGESNGVVGGWFESAAVQCRVGGVWLTVQATPSTPLDASSPFQEIDFVLASPVMAEGVRAVGPVGGAAGAPGGAFVTCAEVDALGPAVQTAALTLDRNGDASIDAEDLYAACAAPADLDRDGAATGADTALIRAGARWNEAASMSAAR